jgi:hypothetical protein
LEIDTMCCSISRSLLSVLAIGAAVALGYWLAGERFLGPATAQEGPDWHKGLPRQHKSKWLVHDLNRPMPTVVTPGALPQDPPSDAIVLFDGKDLSKWKSDKGGEARWTLRDGYMELNNSGSIRTVEEFGDCQLHFEWMAPTPPRGESQARGNSGIFFMGFYELQIVDSYESKTYADGSVASIYGQQPALFNAAKKPGEWQIYDIVFRRPRFNGDEVVEPGRFTVFFNGVLVHHNAEIFGRTGWRQLAKYTPHGDQGALGIQDHGDRQQVRYRNIWIRRLDLSPTE